MLRLKRLAAIMVLALVATFGAPHAFAGDMHTPAFDGDVLTPPANGNMDTPGFAGEMSTPGLAVLIAALFG